MSIISKNSVFQSYKKQHQDELLAQEQQRLELHQENATHSGGENEFSDKEDWDVFEDVGREAATVAVVSSNGTSTTPHAPMNAKDASGKQQCTRRESDAQSACDSNLSNVNNIKEEDGLMSSRTSQYNWSAIAGVSESATTEAGTLMMHTTPQIEGSSNGAVAATADAAAATTYGVDLDAEKDEEEFPDIPVAVFSSAGPAVSDQNNAEQRRQLEDEGEKSQERQAKPPIATPPSRSLLKESNCSEATTAATGGGAGTSTSAPISPLVIQKIDALCASGKSDHPGHDEATVIVSPCTSMTSSYFHGTERRTPGSAHGSSKGQAILGAQISLSSAPSLAVAAAQAESGAADGHRLVTSVSQPLQQRQAQVTSSNADLPSPASNNYNNNTVNTAVASYCVSATTSVEDFTNVPSSTITPYTGLLVSTADQGMGAADADNSGNTSAALAMPSSDKGLVRNSSHGRQLSRTAEEDVSVTSLKESLGVPSENFIEPSALSVPKATKMKPAEASSGDGFMPLNFWEAVVLLRRDFSSRLVSAEAAASVSPSSYASLKAPKKKKKGFFASCCGGSEDITEETALKKPPLVPVLSTRSTAEASVIQTDKGFIGFLTSTKFSQANTVHMRVLYTLYHSLGEENCTTPWWKRQAQRSASESTVLRTSNSSVAGGKGEERSGEDGQADYQDAPLSTRGVSWERVGFQGSDPATDLRATGLLGLLQLLYFIDYYPLLASKLWALCNPTTSSSVTQETRAAAAAGGIGHDLPFTLIGFNLTAIVLDALKQEVLDSTITSVLRSARLATTEDDANSSPPPSRTSSKQIPAYCRATPEELSMRSQFPVIFAASEYYVGCMELFWESWLELSQSRRPALPSVADFGSQKAAVQTKVLRKGGGDRVALKAALAARKATALNVIESQYAK